MTDDDMWFPGGDTDELLGQLQSSSPPDVADGERMFNSPVGNTDEFRRRMGIESSGGFEDQASPQTPPGTRRNNPRRVVEDSPYREQYGMMVRTPPTFRGAPVHERFEAQVEDRDEMFLDWFGFSNDTTPPGQQFAPVPVTARERAARDAEIRTRLSFGDYPVSGEPSVPFESFEEFVHQDLNSINDAVFRDGFFESLAEDKTPTPPRRARTENHFIERKLDRLSRKQLRSQISSALDTGPSLVEPSDVYPTPPNLLYPFEERADKLPFAFFPVSLSAFDDGEPLTRDVLEQREADFADRLYDDLVLLELESDLSDPVYDSYLLDQVIWVIDEFSNERQRATALRLFFAKYPFTVTAYKSVDVGLYSFLHARPATQVLVSHYVALHLLNSRLLNDDTVESSRKSFLAVALLTTLFAHALSINAEAIDGAMIHVVLNLPLVRNGLVRYMLHMPSVFAQFNANVAIVGARNKTFLDQKKMLQQYFMHIVLLQRIVQLDMIPNWLAARAVRYYTMSMNPAWPELVAFLRKMPPQSEATDAEKLLLMYSIMTVIKTVVCSMDEYSRVGRPMVRDPVTKLYPDMFEANFRVLVHHNVLEQWHIKAFLEYISRKRRLRPKLSKPSYVAPVVASLQFSRIVNHLFLMVRGTEVTQSGFDLNFSSKEPWFRHGNWKGDSIKNDTGAKVPLCRAYLSNYLLESNLRGWLDETQTLSVRLHMLTKLPFYTVFRDGTVTFQNPIEHADDFEAASSTSQTT